MALHALSLKPRNYELYLLKSAWLPYGKKLKCFYYPTVAESSLQSIL